MKINRRISSNIELFEQKINYENKNKEYILEALTHSSYSNENKNYPFNERLEFLGDSVLSIVISDYLFKKETKLPEGELTKIRANIVCEESLSEVSKNIHLGKYMLLGVEYSTPLETLKKIPDLVKSIIESESSTTFYSARFVEFADSSLNFEVIYYVNIPDYAEFVKVVESINYKLVEEFAKINANFAFPSRTIYISKD